MRIGYQEQPVLWQIDTLLDRTVTKNLRLACILSHILPTQIMSFVKILSTMQPEIMASTVVLLSGERQGFNRQPILTSQWTETRIHTVRKTTVARRALSLKII